MSTEHATPNESPTDPDATSSAARNGGCDDTNLVVGGELVDGETVLRAWYGLPPEAVVLVPAFTTPPRQPEGAWAMRVCAVDLVGDLDHGAELELFAGNWLAERPPAELCDGDLVVRLTPPYDSLDGVADDVEMLLAHDGRWLHVGHWPHLSAMWPVTVAPTAATVMGLHTALAESTGRPDTAAPRPPSPRGVISELLYAALVTPGDEFLWERRNSAVRHTARVRADGTLALVDGRVYATPTGAATELSGYPQDGWAVFRRVTDGRTLADLRTELHRHQR